MVLGVVRVVVVEEEVVVAIFPLPLLLLVVVSAGGGLVGVDAEEEASAVGGTGVDGGGNVDVDGVMDEVVDVVGLEAVTGAGIGMGVGVLEGVLWSSPRTLREALDMVLRFCWRMYLMRGSLSSGAILSASSSWGGGSLSSALKERGLVAWQHFMYPSHSRLSVQICFEMRLPRISTIYACSFG